MNINQRIRAELETRRNEAINTFTSPNPILTSVYDKLQEVDPGQVKEGFYQELIDNCLGKWSQSAQSTNGIFFEYDYIFRIDGEAEAHGIIYDGFPIQAESYGMENDYDFADNFEGVNGITLGVLNPLIVLAQEPDFWYIEGSKELTDAYLFTAFIALHDALSDFVKTTAFGKLNRQLPFHFVIGEHDHGGVYPVYIAESLQDANKQVEVVSTGLDRRRIRYQNYSARERLERVVSSLIRASPSFDRIRTDTFFDGMLEHIQFGLHNIFELLEVDQPAIADQVADIRAAIQYFSYPENVTAAVQRLDAISADDLANTPTFEYPKKQDYIQRMLSLTSSCADRIILYSQNRE